MEQIRVWECGRCKQDTLLPDSVLQEISFDLERSPKDESFVDFLCPHCGWGMRRPPHTIPARSAPAVRRDSPLWKPALAHVSLECEREGCAARAIVHTLAGSEAETLLLKAAAHHETFALAGITCYSRHPIRQPIRVKATWKTTR